MGQNRGSITTGVILIIVGVLTTLGRLGLGELFGQAFVLGIGVIFLLMYFVGKIEWAIYPGAFTSTVGCVIFLAARNVNMDVFWPLFIMAPGISFLIIRAASPGNQWAIYPGLIVSGVGLVMFLFSTRIMSWFYLDLVGKVWPVVLILAGLLLIFRNSRPGNPADR